MLLWGHAAPSYRRRVYGVDHRLIRTQDKRLVDASEADDDCVVPDGEWRLRHGRPDFRRGHVLCWNGPEVVHAVRPSAGRANGGEFPVEEGRVLRESTFYRIYHREKEKLPSDLMVRSGG